MSEEKPAPETPEKPEEKPALPVEKPVVKAESQTPKKAKKSRKEINAEYYRRKKERAGKSKSKAVSKSKPESSPKLRSESPKKTGTSLMTYVVIGVLVVAGLGITYLIVRRKPQTQPQPEVKESSFDFDGLPSYSGTDSS